MHNANNLRPAIQALANVLCQHASTRRIFNLTPPPSMISFDDERTIFRLVAKSNFMSSYPPMMLSSNFGVFSNVWIAIAVARRVNANVYESVYSEPAVELIEDNMVIPNTPWEAIKERPLAFAKFHHVVTKLIAEPELPELIDNWEQAGLTPEEYDRRAGRIDGLAVRILRNDGIVRVLNFAHIASAILRSGSDANDPDFVKSLLVKYKVGNILH